MKEIIYCTCNTHISEVDALCIKYLKEIKLPVISVSLNKEIDFGDKRIVMHGKKSPLMLYQQMVAGLETSEADFIFFAENDVVYHPSHFDFEPERDDAYYFNVNVWKMRWSDGFCIKTDNSQQVSGMVASRKLLLKYYTGRIEAIKTDKFDGHYEPRDAERVNWESPIPNIDIRHDSNMSVSKWSPKDFRNKKYAEGWKESTIEKVLGHKL